MPKGKTSNATMGARPKPGFEKGHAKPSSGTNQVKGKTNLPLESRRKDKLPKPESI
jgi:hypothetical protein